MYEVLSAAPLGAGSARILTPEAARHALTELAAAELRRSLRKFAQRAWTVIQPQPPIWNWHCDAVIDHLSYVTMGEIRFLQIGIPPRHSKPVSINAMVLEKKRGRIALGEVKIGYRILTHTGAFRRVAAVHEQGHLPTLLIETFQGRRLRLADDHPLLTTRGWIAAKDLIVGDYAAAVHPRSGCGTATMATTEARLLGYLIGDGCVKYASPTFTNHDPAVAADFRQCAQEMGFDTALRNGARMPTISLKAGAARRYPVGKGAGRGQLIGPVRQWMERHAIYGADSYSKRAPAAVLAGDESVVANFLGAYWSCDGFIGKKAAQRGDWSIGCCSVSETLVRDLQHLLLRLGIEGRIRRRVAQISSKRQGSTYVSWHVEITDQDNAARFLQKIPMVHPKFGNAVIPPRRFDRVLHEDQITVITRVEPERCRCLTVEMDHSFTADDLAVHNTMLASVIWPAWHWLHKPEEQFLTAMLNDPLARMSALLERRLIESAWWRRHFGDEIEIYDDENQVGLYRNTKGGYRQIASVQGNVTGLGGSIQIGDDFHDAKKVESDAVRIGTLAWHDNAWRSRLNNPETAQKVYIGQRTHENDVYGHVLEQEGDRWVVLSLPMEFNPKKRCITYRNHGDGPLKECGELFHDPRTVEGEILDPKRFSAKTAAAEKAIMSERAWEAQYNQAPVGQGGLILKRHWWKQWVTEAWRPNPGREKPMPQFSEVFSVYDTAFEADEEADFSARTTWGVFRHAEMVWDASLGHAVQGQTLTCLMLLDSMCEKMTYPDLRADVIKHRQEFEPDWILIEKKASGHDLINELRRKRLPVKAVGLAGSGGRGRGQGDLIARANAASLMLERGAIYYPPRAWALDVVEKASKFPNGPPGSRDIVSTLVIAWMYARRYYDLELPDDERDEINPFAWRQQPKKRYA